MTQQQMQLGMAAMVVLAFILAGGPMLCSDRSDLDGLNFEDDAEFMEMQEEWQRMKANRAASGKGIPRIAGGQGVATNKADPADKGGASSPRFAGAYYPDEHKTQESGGVDPLLIALLGGGFVFAIAGVGVFFVLGSGRKEEEPGKPPEPGEDDWGGEEGGFEAGSHHGDDDPYAD